MLKAPDIPSILVETAFISNPEEEKRLKDSAYQDKMADAILGGIKRYLAQNPPLAREDRGDRPEPGRSRGLRTSRPRRAARATPRRPAWALSIAVASSAVTGREKR